MSIATQTALPVEGRATADVLAGLRQALAGSTR